MNRRKFLKLSAISAIVPAWLIGRHIAAVPVAVTGRPARDGYEEHIFNRLIERMLEKVVIIEKPCNDYYARPGYCYISTEFRDGKWVITAHRKGGHVIRPPCICPSYAPNDSLT